MKKLRGFSRQSPGGFIILGNLVFIAGIIVALTIYTRTYRDKMKTQNVIDIGNITESSATVATDFFLTQKTRLDDVSTYVKNTGLGYSATLDFIANSNSDASTVYELIGTDKTGVVALKENGVYPAISYAANKTTNPYASFATFFAPTDEEKALTRLHCSIEYTDAYTAHQSFALYTYLDLSDGTTTSTYTLMSVHRSSRLDELLSTNTTYSDMAIALMKRNGDYLFATSSFKSDNLFRYFYTFNGLSLNQWNSEASLFYNGEKDTFYYNNAQGEAAVFVTKPLDLEGVTWYAVSSVPLSSFHNLASSVWIIATTIALLSGMMIFNFAWMERANHKLKEAAQKEKEAAAKEKEASDAKSDFFSRMSHDIRTPLNVVIGSSTLALKEKNSPTTERYLSDIDQSGKFLLSLVNDLLDLNKVQNGSMTLHLTPYSLKEFSAAMHSIVGPLCEEKHLSLTLEGFDDDTPYLIDAVRFKQIFYNLLSNSVKFTPSGGKISLRASWGEESEGKRKLIIVENDNGIGMPVMDGYTFLGKIASSPYRTIPTIAVTGENDIEAEQKILDLGAWDFVSKPYQPMTLLTRLKYAIHRSQYSSLGSLLLNSLGIPAAVFEMDSALIRVIRLSESYSGELYDAFPLSSQVGLLEQPFLSVEDKETLKKAFLKLKKDKITALVPVKGIQGKKVQVALRYWGENRGALVVFGEFKLL